MSHWESGWLTILPSGQWYVEGIHFPIPLTSTNHITVPLGPLHVEQTLNLGLAPTVTGRYRTRIRWSMYNNMLQIAPLIGILTSGKGESFKGNRENFQEISKTGQKLGALVFVFTPDGIDWETYKIRGYLYDKRNGFWQSFETPFPHVIYNRIPTRTVEEKEYMQETLKRISKLKNVTLFNRQFFDKESLFTTLQAKKEVAPFLPDTYKLDSFERLKSFARKHDVLYLKPIRGKAGRGIMRLEKHDTIWLLRRVHQQKSLSRSFYTLDELWTYLWPILQRKPYIVQQGIMLATYNDRPFDVRVLTQKNGKGHWDITGIGIRQAGVRSITTHVPRGGSVLSPDKVLPQIFGEEWSIFILQNIRKTVLVIAKALQQNMRDLAEMSMDLGITTDGDIWFFEANSKPEKFDEPDIRRASLRNIIFYSQHMCK
ncbi:YheC/YheD family protein [Brevibacillus laterosporus]|uniref:YheC/YheD family protein n=2 Tax=Brevibacillus TaxID=55080 RepID=A0A0F6XYT0_BRELA|nr:MULTISPECIES: YheC/YheD family protein [Brevibacillus]AKF92561.1 hypothetical protein EX87_01850 [Brevibacillus laterosporus]MCR8986892.1 YheC/YheD family protein [Brevibacillus laterosporus]MCZ0832628.1 YheC/YheD family protein [Brevibacillus halotolerans]GIO01240.1 endospore coat-associated protein YheD [Brevibacillus halotolerans]